MAGQRIKEVHLTDKDIQRFNTYVDKTPGNGPNGDCWIFIRRKNRPRTNFRKAPTVYRLFKTSYDKVLAAHRVAYFIAFGIWNELYVCHKCDNPPCVNPDHLFLGTQEDNVADMMQKGRNCHPYRYNRKGIEMSNAKLDDEKVRDIRIKIANGNGRSATAREFGITRKTLYDLLRGKTWKHVQ